MSYLTYRVLDWCKQVQHFSGPSRELLTHSIALQEDIGGRQTLRILFGPQAWPHLTELLRFDIGLSIGMGTVGVRWHGHVRFEKTLVDPVTTPAQLDGVQPAGGRCLHRAVGSQAIARKA
jgi:hypothetical protein